jgi:hypothetical protein
MYNMLVCHRSIFTCFSFRYFPPTRMPISPLQLVYNTLAVLGTVFGFARSPAKLCLLFSISVPSRLVPTIRHVLRNLIPIVPSQFCWAPYVAGAEGTVSVI